MSSRDCRDPVDRKRPYSRASAPVEADTLGRFSAEDIPSGQISLRCRLGPDQAPIVTGWISL